MKDTYYGELDGIACRMRIVPDPQPSNPREESNIGKMDLRHRRYSLPEEGRPQENEYDQMVILQVWGYDHGSL